MKKYLIFAAAALLALAACSKVTPVEQPDQAITFQVVNHVQRTKANTAFDIQKKFGTFGYWTATDWDTDGDANKIFDNLPVKHDNGVWGFETTQYWPKSGKISFASYAPYVGDVDWLSYSKEGGFMFDGYVIADNADVDLMIADDENNKDCTKETNADGQTVISGTNTNNFTGVPTLFVHVLSQLNFQFQQKRYNNESVTEDLSFITVKKVELVSLYNESTFVLRGWESLDDQDPEAKGEATYTVYDEEDGTVINKEPEVTEEQPNPTPDPTSLGDPKIVLPQILKSGDGVVGPQILKITYDITTKYVSNTTPQVQEDVVTSVNLGNGTLTQWLQNQNITYLVTISPYSDDPITFDPAVAPWAEDISGTISVK